MKKFLVVFIIPFLFLPSNSALAQQFDYSRKDFQEIVNMLDMEGHGNDDVATCNVKQLYYEEVASMMEKGMNKDEILTYYVEQMGEDALKAPLTKGFSLTAWITPFVALIGAVIFVYFIISKWVVKKGKNDQQNYSNADQPLKVSEQDKEILTDVIEQERKKYF